MSGWICCTWLVALLSVVCVVGASIRNGDEFGFTPEEILSAVPDGWLPPLPPFMEGASEESQQEFQLIVTNWDSSVDEKQRQIAALMARQPEHVRRAYEHLQELAALQPFSLEEELKKTRLQAARQTTGRKSFSASDGDSNAYDQIVGEIGGEVAGGKDFDMTLAGVGGEIEGVAHEKVATVGSAEEEASATDKHESL